MTTKIYVGSTIQPLNQRFSKHKYAYKRFLTQKGYYLTSFELLQHEDVDIELIENYPCASRKELESREGVVVKVNQVVCVNKIFPGRTRKEYYEDNKDKILDYKANYYAEHKDKVKDYKKDYQAKYYEDNKDKILEQQAKYKEGNKNKRLEYQAKYREEHKDKIKERQANPFHCECGSTVRTSGRAKHLKTKNHKDFISTQPRK